VLFRKNLGTCLDLHSKVANISLTTSNYTFFGTYHTSLHYLNLFTKTIIRLQSILRHFIFFQYFFFLSHTSNIILPSLSIITLKKDFFEGLKNLISTLLYQHWWFHKFLKKTLTNTKTKNKELVAAFRKPHVTLNYFRIVPKAACDSENFSKNQLWHVRWKKNRPMTEEERCSRYSMRFSQQICGVN
jgi:hypothetical protein